MKAFITLVKLYLNSIFRFSVMRHSNDGRERRNAVMGVVAIVIIIVVYGGMSGMTSYRMISAGVDPAIPFLMIATLASLFALAMAFAQGSATLSAFADFDTLMGMPIPITLIVLARFLALYSVEALYCAAYLLPCGVIYAILCAPVWWFYPVFLIMLLLLPVVVAFSYELNRWVGRHVNWLSSILSAPGKALQRLTVYEPDDGMIECAIEALKLVIPEEKGSDRW